MKKNIGITDRIIRFVIVDLLLSVSYLGLEIPPMYMNVTFVMSLLLILNIITGYSLIYQLFGLSTVEEKTKAVKN
ncbi:MAG: hypothetical protein ACI8P3_004151 [Saprospiraceae bacterium]|jgi:hypothetical protein